MERVVWVVGARGRIVIVPPLDGAIPSPHDEGVGRGLGRGASKHPSHGAERSPPPSPHFPPGGTGRGRCVSTLPISSVSAVASRCAWQSWLRLECVAHNLVRTQIEGAAVS